MMSATDPAPVLRPGTPRDAAPCLALWVAACADRDGRAHDGVAERARPKFDKSVGWIVASGEEQILGFTLATAPRSGLPSDPEDAPVIGLLAIDPQRQARGVGRRLLRAISVDLSASGYRRAVLHSLLDNTAANALYTSEGWTPTGEEFEHSLLERPCRTLIRDLADL